MQPGRKELGGVNRTAEGAWIVHLESSFQLAPAAAGAAALAALLTPPEKQLFFQGSWEEQAGIK